MCGCDYTTNIPGIGPIKAFKYIEECGNIEKVISRIEKDSENPKKKSKYQVPETFYYKEARVLFSDPNVENDKAALQALIKWDKPDEEALKEFLVTQKGFSEVKVESGLKKLKQC
jgi:flap endonuclease-1